MNLAIWRFVTMLFAMLNLGGTLTHVLELRPKMRYDSELYAAVNNTLYQMFRSVGGVLEGGTILCAIVLTVLTSGRGLAFELSLASTICFATALISWILLVEPVNAEVRRTARTVPAAVPRVWKQRRNRWEYSHAARFVLQLTGVVFLLFSVLVETT
jgi:hypothetical protein